MATTRSTRFGTLMTSRLLKAAPPDEQRILITQARAGMVLSRTVETADRVKLCPDSTALSEGLIHRLAARGIKRIWVKGQPVPGPSPEVWAVTVRRLRDRFSRVRHIPFMAELEKLIADELARRS